MVGFNHNVLVIDRDPHAFTFHYGRIQSATRRRHRQRFLYLHSIMVGFNHSPAGMLLIGDRIYIPLWSDSITRAMLLCCQCFLFTFHYGRIQSRKSLVACVARVNLHSIMVGFNRPVRSRSPNPSCIYIPLWSDSIARAFGSAQIGPDIYIPLWSDSIRGWSNYISRHKSIYIPLWSDSIVTA